MSDQEIVKLPRATKPMSTAIPKERVYLVGARRSGETRALIDEHLDELERLVDTAGGVVAGRTVQDLRTITPATLIGAGKVAEIHDTVTALKVDSVVFDHPLTPAQQRNLTEKLEIKVLERAQLILDIFVRNARTREAKVQVQLAQLEYLLPRLAGMWSHLERQRGGIGVRGGAGEAQIELDRRIVRNDIRKLKKKLEQIQKQRHTQRKRRTQVFRVALVGYTNAGKSTLMSRLTGADLFIADQLFATLDPAVKSLPELAGSRNLLLIDTVGFIRKLPHQLVASFRSTLEEVLESDLLLLVADSHSETLDDQIQVVREVLDEIGAGSIPSRLVLNQVDRLDEDTAQHLQTLYPDAYLVSATVGTGIPALVRELFRQEERWKLELPPVWGTQEGLLSEPLDEDAFEEPDGDGFGEPEGLEPGEE